VTTDIGCCFFWLPLLFQLFTTRAHCTTFMALYQIGTLLLDQLTCLYKVILAVCIGKQSIVTDTVKP